MNKEDTDLKKRIADLEEKVQNQQKQFGQALAFLFDRSEYKELIKEGKVEWPKMLTEALNNLRTAQEVPVQEQQISDELIEIVEEKLVSKIASALKRTTP